MLEKRQLGTAVALGALAAVLGAFALSRNSSRGGARSLPRLVRTPQQKATVQAAQRLNRAAGLIATSTLLDSGIEHYRGSFINKAMITPIIVSAASLAVSAHGSNDRSATAHRVRNPVYLAAAVTGLVGTGFHIYNNPTRPGWFCLKILFSGAPRGAPSAVALSGLLGYYSERLRDSDASRGTPRVFGMPAGRALASLTALGLLATSAEAGLLHFRGAYHDPFMYLPVTVPPVAAGLLGETAMSRPRKPRKFTRWWLRLTAFMGLAGPCFHVFGVSRNMGGWKDWRQNILNGPPIPAPPSFTGLALAGLAALELLEEHPNA